MDLKEQFEAAAAKSKSLPNQSNDMLLKIYSLYKQGSVGDINTPPPSNPFDIVGKAKHEAWSKLKGMDTNTAMQQYVELINSLG